MHPRSIQDRLKTFIIKLFFLLSTITEFIAGHLNFCCFGLNEQKANHITGSVLFVLIEGQRLVKSRIMTEKWGGIWCYEITADFQEKEILEWNLLGLNKWTCNLKLTRVLKKILNYFTISKFGLYNLFVFIHIIYSMCTSSVQ